VSACAPGDPCPCGRRDGKGLTLRYRQCCAGPLEEGKVPADAQALMRSRYCAFVLDRPQYLLQTWHASRRPTALEPHPQGKWLGLEVRRHERIDADHEEVEFVARHRLADGRAVRLHERSRFLRDQERWWYVDGDHL
jgi:SEC-C motif-containing protein